MLATTPPKLTPCPHFSHIIHKVNEKRSICWLIFSFLHVHTGNRTQRKISFCVLLGWRRKEEEEECRYVMWVYEGRFGWCTSSVPWEFRACNKCVSLWSIFTPSNFQTLNLWMPKNCKLLAFLFALLLFSGVFRLLTALRLEILRFTRPPSLFWSNFNPFSGFQCWFHASFALYKAFEANFALPVPFWHKLKLFLRLPSLF